MLKHFCGTVVESFPLPACDRSLRAGSLGLHDAFGPQVGDVRSDHSYPNALSSGATATRASICSEFGGLGLYQQVGTLL